MQKTLISIFIACLSLPAYAEDATIAQLFRNANIDGTIVLESFNTGQRHVHNDLRSNQPFTAASTFKILNTLIALEEGVISGADATIPWDGTAYENADWNHDQTLESAFKVSCVWCYQELARKVGAEKYPAYLHSAHYGHLHEPFNETEFWLDGSLTISAEQQIAFLRQVVNRSIPFNSSNYDTLKTIMLAEVTPFYRLYAKTGWSTRSIPNVGWYVGYVETAGDVWLFSLNIDTRDTSDLPLRKKITLDALKAKGIVPAS